MRTTATVCMVRPSVYLAFDTSNFLKDQLLAVNRSGVTVIVFSGRGTIP